jgi:hypothetical protein
MPTTPTAENLDALVQRLERQRDLYRQLDALSREQAGIIAEGWNLDADPSPSEQLLRLLSDRQKLIDELDGLHRQLAPYRDNWQSIWSTMAQADRHRIGPLVSEVEQLLARIIEQDDRDRKQLQQNQQQVTGQMRRVNNAGRAINAYRTAPTPQQNNRFTNQQG